MMMFIAGFSGKIKQQENRKKQKNNESNEGN